MEAERLAQLFDQAVAIDDREARAEFVRRESGDDPELRRELNSLLTAHDQSAHFLETSAVAEALDLVPALLGSHRVGDRIGSWRIDEQLHAGGMGSVFRATRIEPDFTQAGALKLVRVGFETDELLQRFSQERQLLARVEHPHIARLLDGGTTDEGLPWLAMEFVDGLAIDEFADHHRLDLDQRLELFAQLADAISYLHENLITHRDIKASNVLVDNNGHVRVLDFGIASLLSEGSRSAEPLEERRLSLSSAAPEQWLGEPVSTATDVYALGVLLYRLLSGVPPYRIESSQSADEIEQLICRQPSPLASEALAAADDVERLAALRGLSGNRLLSRLRGDLDSVLARAISKQPQSRYRSVADFREDLENCLQHRPVRACAHSSAYLARKFARRHWRALSATAAVVTALSMGLGLALWQAGEAARQRDRAQAMNGFMQEVLTEADPYNARRDRTVRDVLEEASALLDSRFRDQPLLESSLRQVVGEVQLTLLELDAGEDNLRRTLALLEDRVASDDELLLRTEAGLAWVDYERERYDAAVERYESILDRLNSDHDANFRAMIHNDMGVALSELDRYRESIAHQERALALAPDSVERTATLINLGYAYDGLGELEQASEYYLLAIQRLRGLGDAGLVTDLAHALNNYGNILSQQGRNKEALPFYLESLEVRHLVYGADTDSVAVQHLNVGRLLLDMQRPQEALPHLIKAIELFPRFRAPDSIYVRVAAASHARAVLLTGPDERSRSAAVETLASVSAALNQDSGSRESRFAVQIAEWARAATQTVPSEDQPARS